MTQGICYLIGGGPGDPGLITLKGVKALQLAEVVYYDYLSHPDLLKHAPAEAPKIYVGKRAGDHTLPQAEICQRLVEEVKAGKVIARLKGGDPFVFGRGGEEALALAEAGLDFEIIPGITAGVAAPAYAGIPLTHRGVAVSAAFVTGHEDPDKDEAQADWAALAGVDTLCIYMGMGQCEAIVSALLENGKAANTPAAAIMWGTTPRQRTVISTLENLQADMERAELRPPAILMVGPVVNLRERLHWFEKRPLFGKSVLVTRSRTQASAQSASLAALGAEAVELPTIRIAPPESYDELDKSLARMSEYDWLILTSTNGVAAVFERLSHLGRDARFLNGVKVAAIGSATANELSAYGIKADLIPEKYVAESLFEELLRQDQVRDKKYLLCRADIAREKLATDLRANGAEVTEATAYCTLPENDLPEALRSRLEEQEIDAITFASSSTVRNFIAMMGDKLHNMLATATGRPAFISIGPITSATMRELNLPVDAEARQHDIPGLIAAVTTCLQS